MTNDFNAIKSSLQAAASFFGSQAALARFFGIRPQSVNQWFTGKRKPPKHVCIILEGKTGIPAEELRPDVDWGYLRQPQKEVA